MSTSGLEVIELELWIILTDDSIKELITISIGVCNSLN